MDGRTIMQSVIESFERWQARFFFVFQTGFSCQTSGQRQHWGMSLSPQKLAAFSDLMAAPPSHFFVQFLIMNLGT